MTSKIEKALLYTFALSSCLEHYLQIISVTPMYAYSPMDQPILIFLSRNRQSINVVINYQNSDYGPRCFHRDILNIALWMPNLRVNSCISVRVSTN